MGISAFYHDSDYSFKNENLFCNSEERLSEKSMIIVFLKFYKVSIKHNLKLNQIEAIVFYEKPLVKFDRLIGSYVHYALRRY